MRKKKIKAGEQTLLVSALTLAAIAGAAPAMAADNVTQPDDQGNIQVVGEKTLDQNVTDFNTANVRGTLNVYSGKEVKAKQVTLTDPNAKLKIASNTSFSADSVTGTQGSQVLVGNDQGKGTLIIGSANMNGGTIFLDPVWKDGARIDDASQAAIGGTNAAGGLLAVGQNSMLTLGTTSTAWLPKAVADAGNWGPNGVTAALGVTRTQTLAQGQGGITVDGTMTGGTGPNVTANQIRFNANSLLVADVTGLTNGVVFNATAPGVTADFADTSKVYLENVKAGQTVSLVDGTNVTANSVPVRDNVILADRVLGVGSVAADGKIAMEAAPSAAQIEARVPVSSEIAGMVAGLYAASGNDTNSSAADVRFVSRSLSRSFTTSGKESGETLEGAARMALVGGAPAMTYRTSQLGIEAAGQRTSLLEPVGSPVSERGAAAGDGLKNGIGMWATPLYQHSSASGLDAGKFNTGYDSDLGGAAFGVDYTFNDAYRVGVSFNVGGGTLESSGDFNSTKNDFDFWGVNLYGGWMQNNFGLSADVGYTDLSSDIKQDLPSSLGMGSELKSDVDSYAITTGLRGEYKFETEALDIMPHVGVRYTYLKTKSYDIKSGFGKVFDGDSFDQSIWTFPVGVTFSKDIALENNWYFKPKVDLSVIPAAGDMDASAKIRMANAGFSATPETTMLDHFGYQAGLGLEMSKDDMSFGLNYQFLGSENTDNHGIQATFRYDF